MPVVLAVAAGGSLGALSRYGLDALMWGFGLILAALGLRAVAAVVLP